MCNTPSEAWQGLHCWTGTFGSLLQLPCPGSFSGEHPARLTLPGLSFLCSFPYIQTCMASLLPYPAETGANGQEFQTPLPACRTEAWQMGNIFLSLSLCAGALRDGWPQGDSGDSKRQKIFQLVPFNNENTFQLLICSHMEGLPFSFEKEIFQRGRITAVFERILLHEL